MQGLSKSERRSNASAVRFQVRIIEGWKPLYGAVRNKKLIHDQQRGTIEGFDHWHAFKLKESIVNSQLVTSDEKLVLPVLT